MVAIIMKIGSYINNDQYFISNWWIIISYYWIQLIIPINNHLF
jgi:hypothetical protein